MKDLTGYTPTMVIQYYDTATGNIVVLDTITGTLVDDVAEHVLNVVAGNFVVDTEYTIKTVGDTDFTLIGSLDNVIGTVFTATGVGAGTGTADTLISASGTYLNGYFQVVIDKTATATYMTRIAAELNQFITEYNYNYHIDIVEDIATSIGKEDLRVLRGKLAVRA